MRIYSAGKGECHPAPDVTIEVEAFVTDERTCWCDTCLLPSATLYSGFLVNASTLERLGTFGVVQCNDCGLYRGATAAEVAS